MRITTIDKLKSKNSKFKIAAGDRGYFDFMESTVSIAKQLITAYFAANKHPNLRKICGE